MRSLRSLTKFPRTVAAARRLSLVVLTGGVLLSLVGAGPAFAEAPWWRIGSEVAATDLPPGGEGEVLVVVSNLGDGAINGSKTPVVIADKLPPGLTATAITDELRNQAKVECSIATLRCTYLGILNPYERFAVTIKVKVEEPPGTATSLPEEMSVEGGGAPRVSSVQHVTINGEPTPFGVESYELAPFNEDGTPAAQAGSHPFELTSTLVLNQTAAPRQPVALPKDLHFNLPPGLVGDPNSATQCTMTDFSAVV